MNKACLAVLTLLLLQFPVFAYGSGENETTMAVDAGNETEAIRQFLQAKSLLKLPDPRDWAIYLKTGHYEETLLNQAAAHGTWKLFKMILEEESLLVTVTAQDILERKGAGKYGDTALISAAKNDQVQFVQSYFEEYILPIKSDAKKKEILDSALYAAAKARAADTVQFFLDHGASVDHTEREFVLGSFQQATPLMGAASNYQYNKKLEAVVKLLVHDESVSSRFWALCLAIEHENVETAKLLLSPPYSVSQEKPSSVVLPPDSESPLTIAVRKKNIPLINFLLDLGGKASGGPLVAAVENALSALAKEDEREFNTWVGILELLVNDRKADPSVPNAAGKTIKMALAKVKKIQNIMDEREFTRMKELEQIVAHLESQRAEVQKSLLDVKSSYELVSNQLEKTKTQLAEADIELQNKLAAADLAIETTISRRQAERRKGRGFVYTMSEPDFKNVDESANLSAANQVKAFFKPKLELLKEINAAGPPMSLFVDFKTMRTSIKRSLTSAFKKHVKTYTFQVKVSVQTPEDAKLERRSFEKSFVLVADQEGNLTYPQQSKRKIALNQFGFLQMEEFFGKDLPQYIETKQKQAAERESLSEEIETESLKQ